jgi:hypothetical protein
VDGVLRVPGRRTLLAWSFALLALVCWPARLTPSILKEQRLDASDSAAAWVAKSQADANASGGPFGPSQIADTDDEDEDEDDPGSDETGDLGQCLPNAHWLSNMVPIGIGKLAMRSRKIDPASNPISFLRL